MQQPSQRVSPVIFPQRWSLPARPEGEAPAAVDTFRQTEFQLKSDLRLLEEGMNLQLGVVKDTYPAKYRSHAAAVTQMYWSRAFHALSGAALLVTRGMYPAIPALVRSACECLAAAMQLGTSELPEFVAFLNASLRPDEGYHATDVGKGDYHAGGALAGNADLGLVYRCSSELSRPNFGATLIEVAPESNRQKLAITFGDQAFHFGWAQLELGWSLSLCRVLLGYATAGEQDVLGTSEETRLAVDAFLDRCAKLLAAPERCRIEEVVDADGNLRLLIGNFRRQSAGAPRKLLL